MSYKTCILWMLCVVTNVIYAQPVSNLSLSVERGLYTSPIVVNIQADEPTAIIRYTLDGSEPTPSSGLVYSSWIVISTTTFIRAIAYTPTDTTEVVTHSYIYPNEVFSAATNPQLSESLLDIPTISIVTDAVINDGNPIKTSVEFLYPENNKNHQVDAGIRHTNGGAANDYYKKTMRLYFKSEFGPSQLKYDLFEDAPYGEYATDEFDKINLRYGSQDNIVNWWRFQPTVFLRNRWGYDTQLAMGWSSPHGTYMHVYLNGIYNGMYHVHEIPDESFQEEYRGGEKEEYDVIKNGNVVEGTKAARDTAFSKFAAGDYAGFKEDVDIENFIDYHLISWYQGNPDWGQNNWFMARRRAVGEQFQFFLWDMDNSMTAYDSDPRVTTYVSSFNISILIQNSDFAIVMRDRIYKHFFNDGVLTPQKATERFELRVNEIRKGVIAETAQWGSSQAEWLNNVDYYLNDYFPQRTDFVLNALRAIGYYPNIEPPQYSQSGGQVSSGFQLSLSNPNSQGAIYYTTDGTDPRASGGGISPTAQIYTTAFTLPNVVTKVRARVLLNSDWSASCPVVFFMPQDYSPLIINEIHYHPSDTLLAGGDSFEFIEIKNNGATDINLSGTKFTDGIRFTFDKNTIIPADEFIVLARDSTAFFQKYGFRPDGAYEGKLSNKGERIALSDPFDNFIDSVEYNDVMNWDTLADGHGYSLELMNPDFDNALSVSWQHSQVECGTPGAENALQCNSIISEIIINEINYSYNQPFLGIQAEDWVELYNNSSNTHDISNWIIADSDSIYTIPTGTMILPGQYLVFARSKALFRKAHPNTAVIGPTGLGFSSKGEMVALLDPSGCLMDGLNYGTDGDWVSAPDGSGATLSLLAPSIDNAEPISWASSGNYGGTPGAINTFNTCNTANTIIINEINYKSAVSPFPDDWVELHNVSGIDIDISNWQFHDSQNFYTIPNGIVIPAGDFYVLVRDTVSFKNVFPSVTNYSGNFGLGMSSAGEIVGLFDEHRCPIDIVEYDSSSPWATTPNASGPTLSLIDPTYDNDLPGSWVASTQGNAPNGTPGAPNNISDPCIVGLPEIVINEINYNPSPFNSSGDWMELHNISSYNSNLSNWTLQYQNTTYTFPAGTIINADGFLVLVQNTTLFNNEFPTITNYISAPALNLDDDGDRLFLYTDLSCIMDSVAYNDSNSWPSGADGFGASLSVINPISDNANPINWMALQGIRTPGTANEIACRPVEPVMNLKLWLKADIGAELYGTPAFEGGNVTTWRDQSMNSNHASQSALLRSPGYRTNVINGYPVLRFDGSTDWLKINGVATTLSDEASIFAVIKPTSDNNNGYYLSTHDGGDNRLKFGHRTNGELIYDDDVSSLSTENYIDKKTIVAFDITPNTRVGGYINSTPAESWATGVSSTGADRASLGQEFDGSGSDNETSNHWAGDLAEVIIYDEILTDDERHQVETYLAMKYGITIAVGSHLYYQHANYPENIAGIGMDITQCLLQLKSMSVHSGAILSMTDTFGLNQGDFLVWGHDGGSTSGTNLQVPSTTVQRLTRTWRVTETGDVGEVNVSFDLTGLGLNLSDPNDFAILIDSDDGDFTNARTHFGGRSISGNTITFTNVEFDNDDWFTLTVEQVTCPTNSIVMPTSICYLNPTTFSPNTSSPDANYDWSFQQGNPATFSGANTSTYWSNPGTYIAELTITYQHCIDIVTENINVNICNEPPQAVNDFFQINEDDIFSDKVLNNDNDPYGNNLTMDIVPINDVVNGTLSLNANGDFTYTPNPEFSGTDNFSYRMCNDGIPSFCDTASVLINIVYVNDAPITQADSTTILNNTIATGNVLANDSDVENHLLTPVTTPVIFPQNGTVTIQNDGTYFYTPNVGFVGEDTFDYRVCDNGTPQACSEETVHITVEQPCIDVQLYVWMEGAYDTNIAMMHTQLNTSRKMLPGQSLSTQTGQPYNIAPWNYVGTEGETWTDADYTADVVDWVLVSFRTGLAKNTEIQAQAALLLEDGAVEFVTDCPLLDGISPLYVVIEHRNHIGVMTPTPVLVQNGTLVHDFRATDSFRDATSFGQKELLPGIWVMFGGDGAQIPDIASYDINGTDKSIWSTDNGVFGRYMLADYNMDGDISGLDKIIWAANNGISSRVLK